MNDEFKWHAIYTKPRCEKKVAALLTKKKLESYCPLNRVQRQWGERRKIVEEPLFTSYVFARVTTEQFSLVRSLDGIINFVHWLGKPAVIDNNEIDVIGKFVGEYQDIKVERTIIIPDEELRFSEALQELREAHIKEPLPVTVKVRLPSLGYALVANDDKTSTGTVSFFSSRKQVRPRLNLFTYLYDESKRLNILP